MVRAEGDQPRSSVMILAICAAVRASSWIRRDSASSKIPAGVRGSLWRAAGTSASNPPVLYILIQRSSVLRLTRTRSPSGPRCSPEANWRTNSPRWRR